MNNCRTIDELTEEEYLAFAVADIEYDQFFTVISSRSHPSVLNSSCFFVNDQYILPYNIIDIAVKIQHRDYDGVIYERLVFEMPGIIENIKAGYIPIIWAEEMRGAYGMLTAY